MSIFILTVSIPILYMIADLGNARYTRNILYTAADAASLSGAQQFKQLVTSTGSSGQPDEWVYVVDQPRAQAHAEQTLLANIGEHTANTVNLTSYQVTYPTPQRVRVDATAHYVAPNITKALQLFFHSSATIETNLHVYAVSEVVQPAP